MTSKLPDTASPCVFAGSQGPALQSDGGRASALPPISDICGIMSVICEAAYVWDVGTDDLTWLGDAAAVLKVDPRSIASNAAFSGFLDPDNLVSRYDTIVRSGETDRGDGVCYQIQYGFRPEGASGRTIWVEDTGRWYASSDGRPVRAVGVVRAINERHEREHSPARPAQHEPPRDAGGPFA